MTVSAMAAGDIDDPISLLPLPPSLPLREMPGVLSGVVSAPAVPPPAVEVVAPEAPPVVLVLGGEMGSCDTGLGKQRGYFRVLTQAAISNTSGTVHADILRRAAEIPDGPGLSL